MHQPGEGMLIDFLTVDPGFDGTGWAYFEEQRLEEYGTIRVGKADLKKDWLTRAGLIAEQFENLLLEVDILNADGVIIERPKFLLSDEKTTAAAMSDALPKLFILTGILSAAVFRFGLTPKLVLPREWKGTMNKEQTKKRIERWARKNEFAFKRTSHHARDAIGMGLAYLKEL